MATTPAGPLPSSACAFSPFDLGAYDYALPAERIAQRPRARRDASRLLFHDRATGRTRHRRVHHLPELLRPGDLVVVNDTRVRPARLRGETDTGARVELLLVEELDPCTWECLARPQKRLRAGRRIRIAGAITAEITRVGEARARVTFPPGTDVAGVLERCGEVPLPPYIARQGGPDGADRERYQTIFAREPGAVAAPTAGLHFTPDLLRRLRERDVGVCSLTLHVGPATFAPIRESDLRRHRMEPERVGIPAQTAVEIARAKREGRRVVAVGTTTTRALESRAHAGGGVDAGEGSADRFILPGDRFAVVDALLTNFHLPRSTLLALVCAFAGRDAVLALYAEAVERGYRFYSYGDAMLIC